MDIGIQSNVWGADYHKEKMPQMLAEIAEAGYAGIEIGAHRFESLDHPETFAAQVKTAGLHVAGIHTLVKFYLDGNLDYPSRAADFTQAVGSRFMLVSGERTASHTRADYEHMAEIFNQVGEICRERGITYCYHNHDWEIGNDQAELRTLLELTDPAWVALCLDIGWVQRAGADPARVSATFLDRIRYFHLKDTLDGKFTELGRGTLDFAAWLERVRGQGDFYLAHERDEVLPNALESARQSRQFLKGLAL